MGFVATKGIGPRTAVDIGYGAGVDSLFLLNSGFHVLAIDSSRSAAVNLRRIVPAELSRNLSVRASGVQHAKLPPADLIWAGLCLPYIDQACFPGVWSAILSSLKPGAVFAGDFFGTRHAWAGTLAQSCFSSTKIRSLLRPLELLSITTERGVRLSVSREPLHNEMFTVIARKRLGRTQRDA